MMEIIFRVGQVLKKISIFMVLLVSGCDGNHSPKKIDTANLCAEMAVTMSGFSGPSKRLDIMKNYGIEPIQTADIETLLGAMKSMKDNAETFDAIKMPDRARCVRMATPSCGEWIDNSINLSDIEKSDFFKTVLAKAEICNGPDFNTISEADKWW